MVLNIKYDKLLVCEMKTFLREVFVLSLHEKNYIGPIDHFLADSDPGPVAGSG